MSNVSAEINPLESKIAELKQNLKQYLKDAPRPGFKQRWTIWSVVKKQRSLIAEDVQKLRELKIAMRNAMRKEFTHEQLLQALEMKDKLQHHKHKQRPLLLLQQLEVNDRIELFTLLRNLKDGSSEEISQNLTNIFRFLDDKVAPTLSEKLNLTRDQQWQLDKIKADYRPQLQQYLTKIISQLYTLRSEIQTVLTTEQKTYIENHRPYIQQQVLAFITSL